MGQSKPITENRRMDESLFSMWRAVIAMGHADGVMHDNELAHFRHLFNELDKGFALTPEQRDRLTADLAAPQDMKELVAKITDVEQRCLLVGFAQIVAHIDGELHPKEKEVLLFLLSEVPETPHSLEISEAIRRDIASQMAQRAADMVSEQGVRGCALAYALNALLNRLSMGVRL